MYELDVNVLTVVKVTYKDLYVFRKTANLAFTWQLLGCQVNISLYLSFGFRNASINDLCVCYSYW